MNSPTGSVGSLVARITSICPFPKMPPEHALGHIWKACSAFAWRRSRVRVSSGLLTFSLDLQVDRKEEIRAAPEVAHAIRAAIDLALEAREAGERRVHTLQPLRTRALRPRRLRAVPGGRACGPRALRGGDREGRRQHTGLGRRKWPGSTAPSRTDEGRERIRDARDRCVR
jgi:hypothetical protein